MTKRPTDSSGAEIRIRGLRALGRHGVLPEEQIRPQPFTLDITIRFDAAEAVRTDELEHTVDYVWAARQAVHIVERERFTLVERLAARICDSLLEEPRVEEITVCVGKPNAALGVDAETVEVVLRRQRNRA